MVDLQKKNRPKGSAINHAMRVAEKSKGVEGMQALASLLIAMEANDFVLTTGSNWSRLMNELRKSILNPMCKGCTRMIDLRPE